MVSLVCGSRKPPPKIDPMTPSTIVQKTVMCTCITDFAITPEIKPDRGTQLLAIQGRWSILVLVALRQNSGALHGPDNLGPRSPEIQFAGPCSESSHRRKEFTKFPANHRKCFCVVNAPEIHDSPGLVVVSEFLAAI
jgi:hypothetical protein